MNKLLALSILATAVLLTGCGGGGGGGSAGGTTSTSSPDTSNLSGLAEDVQAFNYLNKERLRCGFGSLTRMTALDNAAKAHANWMIHTEQFGHTEDPTLYPAGFTGVSVSDRIDYQNAYPNGYKAFETIASLHGLGKTGEGVNSMSRLLNAPYHSIGLLDGYRDVGAAVINGSEVGLSSTATFSAYLVGNDLTIGKQQVPIDAVATYPCDGSEGVANQLTNETPNPVTGRNLATNPLGVTFTLKVTDGQRLTITSASVVETSTGQAVSLRPAVGGYNNTPDPVGEFSESMAYISADVPMNTFTKYTATITGTNNGTPFSKVFSFTTGSSY